MAFVKAKTTTLNAIMMMVTVVWKRLDATTAMAYHASVMQLGCHIALVYFPFSVLDHVHVFK